MSLVIYNILNIFFKFYYWPSLLYSSLYTFFYPFFFLNYSLSLCRFANYFFRLHL